MQAVLKYCNDSGIRKQIAQQKELWATSGEFDNRPLVLQLLKLNQDKAKLLGYANAAEMFLWDTMAQTPDQAFDFITGIAAQAQKKGKAELETLKTFFNLETLESRDLPYYARKYQELHYAFDEEALKAYFELGAVLQWLHRFVGDFFGLEFRFLPERSDEVFRYYAVYQEGKLIAYYLLDPFYRQGKRPGAWAEIIRGKSAQQVPLIINVCNFQKSSSGAHLLSLRDTETLFHEFGHALHAMCAGSEYADLSGFNVEWDFVELPSQLMENWVLAPEALRSLAKHYQT